MFAGGQDRSMKLELKLEEPENYFASAVKIFEKIMTLKILRNYYYWLSHGKGKAWYSICTTSKPAHSSEILYDKCFFEYITNYICDLFDAKSDL